MRVVDILKNKSESLTKHHLEMRELMSPVIKDYWSDFVSKASSTSIAHWFRDSELFQAVNEEIKPSEEESFQLSEAAKVVYVELSEMLGVSPRR